VKTILVVDDDADAAEVMAQALAGRGRRVHFYSDPVRAVAALERVPVDLLLVDLAMPWLDGERVLGQVRARCPTCALVLVSGHDEAQAIAARHGVPFVAQPVDPGALRRLVAGLLGDDDHVQEMR
jgi:CheY-like chemotaxis protein